MTHRCSRPRIVVEHVTRLADDLAPEWPQPVGLSGYRIIVTGNPTYTCDVQMMGDDGDHNTPFVEGIVECSTRVAKCRARAAALKIVSAMWC